VELLVDGKSLGTKPMPRNEYFDWEVPDSGGELTAIGYNQEREAARYTISPAGAPAAVRLIAEMKEVPADGESVAPVRVEVVDAKGRIVPNGDPVIQFSVSGPARWRASGTATPPATSRIWPTSGGRSAGSRWSWCGLPSGRESLWSGRNRGGLRRPVSRFGP
jgi:beta-galactosidase